MTRIKELKQRVQRLPELTKQADLIDTLDQTQEKLASVYSSLVANCAAAKGLSLVAEEIDSEDLRQQATVCRDKVNNATNHVSKLRVSVRRSRMLPPSIEKQIQGISGAQTSADSRVNQMWKDMAWAIARDQALLGIARRLGIAGAQELTTELATLAGSEPPSSSDQVHHFVSCYRRAKQAIESLPQEGPVGVFLKKLVQGDGVALSELDHPEVRAFVERHGLEQRLVVRLMAE